MVYVYAYCLFVAALCTELEKTGVQLMFTVYKHFAWEWYTFSYLHSLTVSRGSKHLCSGALVLYKSHLGA